MTKQEQRDAAYGAYDVRREQAYEFQKQASEIYEAELERIANETEEEIIIEMDGKRYQLIE